MNNVAKQKLITCLELCKEFVKDNDTYYTGISGGQCSLLAGGVFLGSSQVNSVPPSYKSADIRKKAEDEASKLERERKAANLLNECLEYLKTVKGFEEDVKATKKVESDGF